MGEALQSATIISFPVLFPVDFSCQKREGKKKIPKWAISTKRERLELLYWRKQEMPLTGESG